MYFKILSALSRSFLIYIISPLTISLTDIASRKKFNIMHKLTIQPSDAFKRKKVLLNFFMLSSVTVTLYLVGKVIH